MFGWFEYEEITRGYFAVLYNILINYGIPYKIKTDNRSAFSTNRKNKFNITQFGKICEYLGIVLETTSNAVSKANVERENGTFKNRLITELRHENITDVDRAIEYINKVFIPKMSKNFSYNINEENSMMKQNDYTYDDLNLIISKRYTRIIDNASSIEEGQIINVLKQKYVLPANHPWKKDMKKFFNNN